MGSGRILLATLLLLGLGKRLDAQAACVSSTRFEIEPQAPLPNGLQGKLVLRPQEGKGEPLTLTARVGSPVSVDLPCASEWEVSADFPNAWGPRRAVIAGAAGKPVTTRMALWPLGRIGGAVKLAEKEERLPKTITVRTLPPHFPNQRDTPRGTMDCPVDDQGKWSCPPLPATTFDLVLSAGGFIPQYRWGLTVLPEKTTDLGTLVLKKGASVAGWVEVEGGAIDPACRARLTPLIGPGGGVALAEKIRSTGVEVPVRKDGFFQIEGVAPGDYSLEVRQPGFAEATVHPIAVSPRSETFLRQPVVLTRPLDLELAISPPLDWLGHPWKVLLLQASSEAGSFEKTLYTGAADEQGKVRIPRQTPGRFRMFVTDSLDNQLALETFQVTGPENASQEIRLKILTVRGVIKLGKEPLAATLWFGGRHGSESVKLESDRDGKFHGVLPKTGWWTVDVVSAAPRFEMRTRAKVESAGEDRASVEIDLPATRVYGKVVDDAGHPAPAATVVLSTDEGAVHMDSDETGSFDFRGVPEGLAHAGATLSSALGEWSSDRISLFLHDGEDVGPVEVRLRKEIKLAGKVQSARGPIPGAGVMVTAIRPILQGGDSVHTELDGTFTARVPALTELADVIVSAPGFGLKAFPVALGEGATQPLSLEEQSGDLQVLFPSPDNDDRKNATTLWIFQNGLPVPKPVLFQWANAHGRIGVESQKDLKSLSAPEMAPGEYRACLAVPAILVPWQASGWTAPLAKCVSGTLAAGGTLRLDLSQP
jgi:hypothetical protein